MGKHYSALEYWRKQRREKDQRVLDIIKLNRGIKFESAQLKHEEFEATHKPTVTNTTQFKEARHES